MSYIKYIVQAAGIYLFIYFAVACTSEKLDHTLLQSFRLECSHCLYLHHTGKLFILCCVCGLHKCSCLVVISLSQSRTNHPARLLLRRPMCYYAFILSATSSWHSDQDCLPPPPPPPPSSSSSLSSSFLFFHIQLFNIFACGVIVIFHSFLLHVAGPPWSSGSVLDRVGGREIDTALGQVS